MKQILQGQNQSSGGDGSNPPPTVTDVCPNIDGNQAIVPDDMHLDDQNNCVADIVIPPQGDGGSGGDASTTPLAETPPTQ